METNHDTNSSFSIKSVAITKNLFSTPRFNCDLFRTSTSFFCAICMRVVAHQRGSGQRRGAQWWIIISFSRQAHLRSRVDVVVTVVVARPSVIIKWPVIRAAGLYGTERIIYEREMRLILVLFSPAAPPPCPDLWRCQLQQFTPPLIYTPAIFHTQRHRDETLNLCWKLDRVCVKLFRWKQSSGSKLVRRRVETVWVQVLLIEGFSWQGNCLCTKVKMVYTYFYSFIIHYRFQLQRKSYKSPC